MDFDMALRPLKTVRILIIFFAIKNFWLEEHHFNVLLVSSLPESRLEAFEGPEEQCVARNISPGTIALNRGHFEFEP